MLSNCLQKVAEFTHILANYFQQDKENVVEANFNELEKDTPSDSNFTGTLKNNTDLLARKAEYYHQCGEYQKCFELTSLWVFINVLDVVFLLD